MKKLKNAKTMIKKLKSTKESTTIMEDDIVNSNKDNVCSYDNCNFKTLKLEICLSKDCFYKLHHICQNNMDFM